MDVNTDLLIQAAKSELAGFVYGIESFVADLSRDDSWLSRMVIKSAWPLSIAPHLSEAMRTGEYAPVHYECRQVVKRWIEYREKYAPLPKAAPAPAGAQVSHANPPPEKQPISSVDRKRPPLQQQHQEDEILRVIAELGYDAKALPKDISGKPGVKAQVRSKLKFSTSVFDKAWGRLSADKGEIRKLK